MEAPQASLPHTPPRGCRPLEPCFAQPLNSPEAQGVGFEKPLIPGECCDKAVQPGPVFIGQGHFEFLFEALFLDGSLPA